MNEQEFALRIKHRLDRAAAQVPADVQSRLFAARQQALAAQQVRVGGLSLAGMGRLIDHNLFSWSRPLVGALVLALAVGVGSLWSASQHAAENEEIDSALLSDDLPIDAYLDHGFDAWLKRDAKD